MSDVFITCILFKREDEPDIVRIPSPNPDDRVVPRLVQEYRATRGRSLTASGEEDDTLGGLSAGWEATDPGEILLFRTAIPRSATFAELEAVFGEELHDPSGPVWIEHTYSGGDVSDLVVFFEWLGNLALVWETVHGGKKLRRSVVFRREREAVKRWHDSGDIDDELRELIEREFNWSDRGFSERFGVSDRERGELLRACGFRREYIPEEDDYTWVRGLDDEGL